METKTQQNSFPPYPEIVSTISPDGEQTTTIRSYVAIHSTIDIAGGIQTFHTILIELLLRKRKRKKAYPTGYSDSSLLILTCGDIGRGGGGVAAVQLGG